MDPSKDQIPVHISTIIRGTQQKKKGGGGGAAADPHNPPAMHLPLMILHPIPLTFLCPIHRNQHSPWSVDAMDA